MKGQYEPEQGMILHPNTITTMLFWLVLCMTGLRRADRQRGPRRRPAGGSRLRRAAVLEPATDASWLHHLGAMTMKLGFVSAILPEYTLEQVLSFAHKAGFSSVELMCWPPGKAERRYAGVTHLDVTDLSPDAIAKIQDLLAIAPGRRSPGWAITPTRSRPIGPRPRSPSTHLHKVIDAAAALGVGHGQHVRRPRPGPVGRRQLAAVPRDLAAAGRARREQERADRHRELPDALHARTNGPAARTWRPSPAIWRRMFARHPQPELRPELRPLALDLAADGLPRAARRVPRPDLPRPRQGRPDRPRPRSTSTASCRIPSSGTRPRSPAWATSAGGPSSAP